MSTPELQETREHEQPSAVAASTDANELADTNLATQFEQKVLMTDVFTLLPASEVIFDVRTAGENPPSGAVKPSAVEVFHEGDVVPNFTFDACKPGCLHSQAEHFASSLSRNTFENSEIKHVDAGEKGNLALISSTTKVIEIRAARKSGPRIPRQELKGSLCELCKSIDFWTLQNGFDHRVYSDLDAEKCDFCGLLIDSVLDPGSFIPDLTKKIRLLGKCHVGSQCVGKIEVQYPSLEKDRVESANKDSEFVRCVELDVFTDHDHPYHHYFTGRTVAAADDPVQMNRWLDACITGHKACNQDSYLRGIHPCLEPPLLPKRVIDVGGTEDHPEPFLFESKDARGQYISLSHRWGTANMQMTTLTNIEDYKKVVKFSSLCKTFQDAITITRKLGFQYIWIDALCIIQDSAEDWRDQASKMADIYRSSTVTLSASIAASGDSGLILPRDTSTAVQLPLRVSDDFPQKNLLYYVAPRCLSTFVEDVENGTLAKRAWCLQERVLPLRIIHFGKDQLHWECVSGCFSECETTGVNSSGAVRDMQKTFAAVDAEWQQQRAVLVKNKLPDDGKLKQVYGRGHYGKWYQMITEYTKREITKETDRLPALAGLAQAWAQRTGEIYACGLWNDDLAAGLLWSGSSFYAPYGTPSNLHKPSERTAPSWSWLSLDGPIQYPLGKLGPIDIERPWFVGSRDKETLSTIGGPGPAFIKLTGRARPLVTMQSFSPGLLVHLAQNHQKYNPDHIPRIAFDEDGKYDFRELWCLLVAFRGCGEKTCGHDAACGLGFAYGLLLWPNMETGFCRRVGIAQTFQADWEGVARDTILLE